MIKIENLSVSYKGFKALDNISFDIKKGEIVALVGQNGAGKSSLLKSITKLIKPDKGIIIVNGSIGWMPEIVKPDPLLTVREFLMFAGYLKKVPADRIKNQVENVITDCMINDKADTYCSELSKGLMQRVIFGSSLIGNPEILILDEPSSGLDPLFQKQMISMISKLGKDKTVIISTHNIAEIEMLGSRVIVLKDGTISFDSSGYKGVSNSYYEYF